MSTTPQLVDQPQPMTFDEALERLGIVEYRSRIWHSNSHGELFHLHDYYLLATRLKTPDLEWFNKWFTETVEWAEKNWKRPESIFQHILTLFIDLIKSQHE